MFMLHVIRFLIISLFFLTGLNAHAVSSMKQDNQHVRVWNTFAEDLYQLHLSTIRAAQIQGASIRAEKEMGGYPGNKNFFEETRYYNSESGKLISRIQRELKNKSNIHLIEVFLYDEKDRVSVDYLAVYLPEFRNAPIQTLINLHHYNDMLHAFRQFDASGTRIYEQCKGQLFNDSVFISLDEDELINIHSVLQTDSENNQYISCFEFVPKTAGNYIKPANIKIINLKSESILASSDDEFSEELKKLNSQIDSDSMSAMTYVKRGDVYFKRHEFEKAVNDYTAAIKLDKNLDEAFFGRGMALGRQGMVQQGINDLSIYIKRHPYNSRAYTKRGVRYIWLGNNAAAKKDMLQAVQLDIRNAEAHDDLGVIYASENNLDKAVYHFKQSIYYDRSYQKAYHNLAMAYVVTGRYPEALAQVDKGLLLENNNRNTLLLKSTILEKLGQDKQANAIREHAEFLPEGNWSERFSAK